MNRMIGLFKRSENKPEAGGMMPAAEERLKCPVCKSRLRKIDIKHNKMVCPECGYHYRLNARSRLKVICDKDSFQELFTNISTSDPLIFPGYRKKLEELSEKKVAHEGVLCGTGTINGYETALFIMDPSFMMGSMGSVVGEKISRLFEYAIAHHLPVVGFTASGGARMQ